MTVEEFELLDDSQATEFLCARFRTLADAGYDSTLALMLAVHPDLGLEPAAAALLDACSTELLVPHAA